MVNPVDAPTFTSDTATEYKANIDSSIRGLADVVSAFAPREQDPATNGITIEAGRMPHQFAPSYSVSTLGDLTVGATTIGSIAAAGSGLKQLHVISFNWESFTYTRTFSTAVADTTADSALSWPTVPAGDMLICAIIMEGTDATITNDMIVDLRCIYTNYSAFQDGAGGNVIVADKNGSTKIEINAFADEIRFKNNAGTTVAYIDSSGNLHIDGTTQTF